MGTSTQVQSRQLRFSPSDNQRLRELCGPGNEHIIQIEARFDVKILHRDDVFVINGAIDNILEAETVLQRLYQETKQGRLSAKTVHQLLQQPSEISLENGTHNNLIKAINTRHKVIKARTAHQAEYIQKIQNNALNFGIGPSGTGKTYLAVACAVQALEKGHVQRLIFVRPAVEAGEKLGFLPGDLEEKILPYLRPLYDALYEMLGSEQAQKLIEQDIIEIAPLAFMRGRTLNDAFIILDEAQNTTISQMKMFLTRLGFGSTAVVTGDVTQVDLPLSTHSGLAHAKSVLTGIEGISFSYFDAQDVVRHPLVAAIIKAYDAKDEH